MGYDNMKVEGMGKFLKVESGSFVDVNIITKNPYEFYQHGGGKDKVICTCEDCSLCADPSIPEEMTKQKRWKINVFDRKDSRVKIFEFGGGVARQIRDFASLLKESDQTIHGIDLRIKAEGANKAKRYSVMQKGPAMPLPEGLKEH